MSDSRAVCSTCGSQYGSVDPPERCIICDEERQFVGQGGQQWTTAAELIRKGHKNTWEEMETGVSAIGVSPKFGIGQRCYLINTGKGNILFDIVAFLDNVTIQKIKQRGGIHAIYFSHPHYYGNMSDWAAVFGCQVHIPIADKQYVTEPGDHIKHWSGEQLNSLADITVLRTGGHFPGSCVLHWPGGSHGKGTLFSGDTIQVVPDNKWVSFMYSYPNLIPLPISQVERIRELMEPWKFEILHGAFATAEADGSAIVQRSARRYIGFLDGSEQRDWF